MTFHIYEIAQLCHEVNRAYCQALGDDSQPSWEDAPQWQRDSAVLGVDTIMNGTLPDPEVLHNSWLRDKQLNGWSYGPVKDAEKKEHPCCVPYDQLPPEQKAKDYLFGAIVATVLSIQGEQLGDGLVGARRS